MIQLTRAALLLGMAGGLMAQTLSIGEITQGTCTAPCTPPLVVNVVLAGNGASIAGLQFDASLSTPSTVTVALGAAATAASKELSTTTFPLAFPQSSQAAVPNGVRVIIIGADNNVNDTSVTANPIADGVVATLTIPNPTATQTLSLVNLMGTTPGGQSTAAAPVTLSTGAAVNLYSTYLVGNVYAAGSAYPPSSESAPNFGTPGKLNINDLLLMLKVATHVTGYDAPPTCSDYFDAMDAYPEDTATLRGGNGVINISDLLTTLKRATNVQGYTIWPVRTARGLVCSASTTSTPQTAFAARPPEVQGTIELGATEVAGGGQVRVPVYARGGRDLARAALAISLGDERSQLRFVAAQAAPSLLEDTLPGVISAAWMDGLDVRAGQRLLLGYVVGPAGSAANLRVFGVSAASLNDNQEIGFDVSGSRFVEK